MNTDAPIPVHLKTLLSLCGFAGLFIGASILVRPVPFYATTGIDLSQSVSMLSELRAIGATFVSCSVLVLLGTFRSTLTRFAILLSAMLYLSCAFGRLISLVLDGTPSTPLLIVMSLEWVIGLTCAGCAYQVRRQTMNACPN